MATKNRETLKNYFKKGGFATEVFGIILDCPSFPGFIASDAKL